MASTSPHAPVAPVVDGPQGRRAILLGASLILIGFNLRPVFGSLSVVLPEIMHDTGLSSTGASVLTTLPLLCLGVFAVPAPLLAQRFGTERTLLGVMLLICFGTALRGTGSLSLLFVASVLAGAGIAVGNVLLPGLLKRDFTGRSAMMMGLYTLAVCAGASTSAAFTVPIAHWFGSWPVALGSWAAPAAVVIVLWLPYALAARGHKGGTARPRIRLHRDALAWQVTCFMGFQSALAYIVMGWLAPMLRGRGLDSATAGYVVGVAIFVQLGASLVTPSIAARRRDQRGVALAVTLITIVAMLALLFAPLEGRWLYAVLLGCGQGGSFALALSLIVWRSPGGHVTTQLSAMAQGWGYALAAAGVLLAGLLRGLGGAGTGLNAIAVLLILLAGGMAWSGWGAGRRMLVRPE